MSLGSTRTATLAWAGLIAVTVASFGSAEMLRPRALAVAVIFAIVAAKVAIILARFMDLRTAPPGVRLYMAAWTAICCTAILALYVVADPG